jgi:hypothetical protein
MDGKGLPGRQMAEDAEQLVNKHEAADKSK